MIRFLREIFSLSNWKKLVGVFYRSILNFIEDRCLKISASLAYYSIFSIGPIIIIVSWLIGFLYGQHLESTEMGQQITLEMEEILGVQISEMIHGMLENMSLSSDSNAGIIIGIGTLLFTSTTVFVEIQDSLNIIWGIRPTPKKNWLKFIFNRLTSFSVVIGLGLLLIASLLVNSILIILASYVDQIIPGISNQILKNLNVGLTFVVISLIFGFIFKFLPDGKANNRSIIVGALITALLFMLGRYGISFFIQHNITASAFGVAGAVILLLLWVYYSAAILYFGAEFTKEHSKVFGNGIKPNSFAVLTERKTI